MKLREGPCYRENCKGPMKLVDGIFVCQSCGLGTLPKDYISWYIEDGTNNNDPEDDYYGVPDYEELYDDEGKYIYCPKCYNTLTPLKGHNDQVTCPRCGSILSQEEMMMFFGL